MSDGAKKRARRCDCRTAAEIRTFERETLRRLGVKPGEGAPNLDAQTGEDLMDFWACVRFGPVRMARLLFPERPKGYVTATERLAAYASNKSPAMSCRARGELQGAECYESICEGLYERLPEWARW